jgi:hypothetical protein
LVSALLLAGCSSGPVDSGGSGGEGGTWAQSATSSASTGTGAGTGTGGGASTSVSSSGSTGTGGGTAQGEPPFGGSSGGSGGPAPVSGTTQQAGGISYQLIVPSAPASPSPLLIVFSGTEGGMQMTNNLMQVGSFAGTDQFIQAVLDGVQYNGNGAAGATVMDDLRSKYNIDNDRTYLLGESAGTTAALQLGFNLRQSYFAAYWANDINATGSPSQNAAALGFQPWGQVGPGGQFAQADQIVAAMSGAGYRLPSPAPYAGSGADTHGHPDQFVAAISWFPGKSRKGP